MYLGGSRAIYGRRVYDTHCIRHTDKATFIHCPRSRSRSLSHAHLLPSSHKALRSHLFTLAVLSNQHISDSESVRPQQAATISSDGCDEYPSGPLRRQTAIDRPRRSSVLSSHPYVPEVAKSPRILV